MKKITNWLMMGLLVLTAMSCQQQPEGKQLFNMNQIAKRVSGKASQMTNSEVFNSKVLKIDPKEGNDGVVIWQKGDKPVWTDANYLVFEVFDEADYSGVINLEFYKEVKNFKSEQIVLQGGDISGTTEDTPWLSCMIGVLPRLKTQIVFPLSYMDAQEIFLPRSPRQLKATLSGNRLDPADITKVVLRFGPYDEKNYRTGYELASVSLTQEKPEPYPSVSPTIDKLGQRVDKDWPGKLKDEADMIARNKAMDEEMNGIQYPTEWSKFGGWKAKKFKATGFFRTQHDGTRWWLVDPEGYAFLSTGIDCIGANSTGPVNGIEDLFEWLPDANDEQFGLAVSERRGTKVVDFYVANLIRIWGKDWKENWMNYTEKLMKKIRFNTVGNWSDISFARHSKIPYVLPLGGFPSTKVAIYRDFPDVFAAEYQENAAKFAAQLESYKNDPYLVGYFLRNEPQWAFGYHNLAYEMFATDQASATKDAFVDWLKGKYNNDIKAVNKAWNLELADFDALKAKTFKEYPSDTADKDFNEFSMIMVKRYVDIPCDEVEKVDKNHMNLGMRYAWLSSDLLYKAGERFDVFSINGYGLTPPPTAEIAEKSGKPVMIGEFHHGAVDRALPATGIVGVMSQEERAAAFRQYLEQGFARPELVGMHYFQWVDQPYYGRFDGENYNIGVVTTGNIPYDELTKGMTITNERIYDVATGKVPPFDGNIPKTPAIHY